MRRKGKEKTLIQKSLSRRIAVRFDVLPCLLSFRGKKGAEKEEWWSVERRRWEEKER